MIPLTENDILEMQTEIDIVSEWILLFDQVSAKFGVDRKEAMAEKLKSIYKLLDRKIEEK